MIMQTFFYILSRIGFFYSGNFFGCSARHYRSSPASAGAITAGKIMLHPNAHKVYLDGQEITLTYKEYELLAFLMANPGQIFNREQLLNRVWGYDFEGTTRTVDTHIKTLRQKLGDEGRHIVTLIRSGYKFEVTV